MKPHWTPVTDAAEIEALKIQKYRVFWLKIGDCLFAIAEQLRDWRAIRNGKRL